MTGFELIAFLSCMLSFAATITALFAFLKKKRLVFFHVLCVLCAFFLISVNSFFAHIHGMLSEPVLLIGVGCAVGLAFSAGVLGCAADYTGLAEKSRLRLIPWGYGIAAE